jgi:hypothetical protein
MFVVPLAIYLIAANTRAYTHPGKDAACPACRHPHQGFKKFKHFSPFYTYNIT